MWMAELSHRSGFSVATIKYYLREGLLPAGTATGATRSSYDETHLRRLRLVRALTEVAGLRLDVVRQVLDGIDGAGSWHGAMGAAHTRLPHGSDPTVEPTAASADRVAALLERHGWELAPGHPQALQIARHLDTLDELEHPVGDEVLDLYAEAMKPVAAHEVASVQAADLETTIEAAVVGTLVQEPILLAIRRIAQENVSRASG